VAEVRDVRSSGAPLPESSLLLPARNLATSIMSKVSLPAFGALVLVAASKRATEHRMVAAVTIRNLMGSAPAWSLWFLWRLRSVLPSTAWLSPSPSGCRW
jgi:hypothetical protein